MTPPPDHAGPGGPTKPPKSPAERQRRSRARKKKGVKMLRAVFTKRYLDDLVSDGDGRIALEDLDNPDILGGEIEEDYYCQKHGTFQPGPIVVTGTSTSS